MEPHPTVVVPVRSFRGFSRLADHLDPDERTSLGRSLSGVLLAATADAGLHTIVVSSDADVTRTATAAGTEVIEDPGTGLDDAAAAGVDAAAGPWVVVHADLPFVTPHALLEVARRVCAGATVIVPSLDGGTTVIGGSGPPAFAFGPGSFHRHLAMNPRAEVVPDPRLAVDIDTPIQLRTLRPHIGFWRPSAPDTARRDAKTVGF